jgi:DNA repair protein RadC
MKLPEITITIKKKKIAKAERIKISSSKDACDVFRTIFNADTFDWLEESIILCLNRANEVIGYYKVSSGGTAGTVIDPKVVFTIGLKSCAQGLIIAHNHPSGTLRPSDADKTITKRLVDAGKTLDMPILDHVILTEEGYYSFADNGLI